jgi:hypothetical protein
LWPVVFGPVESGSAQPVLQREFVAVVNAHPALFGTVDEEQSAEGPERLATQVGGVLLFDNENRLAAFDELAGGDQSGQARPDNDDVSVHGS